jgi:hypothetical protein
VNIKKRYFKPYFALKNEKNIFGCFWNFGAERSLYDNQVSPKGIKRMLVKVLNKDCLNNYTRMIHFYLLHKNAAAEILVNKNF